MATITITSSLIERLYDCPGCGGISTEKDCCEATGSVTGHIEYADCE